MKHLKELLADAGVGGSTSTQTSLFEGVPSPGKALAGSNRYRKILVPLRTPTGSRFGKALLVKLFDSKIAHRHLLWHAIFGKITCLEWFILLQNLEFATKRRTARYCACLAGVLSLTSNTRDRFDSWTSQTRPIHRSLKSKKTSREILGILPGTTLLDFVMTELDVPQKGMSKENLINVTTVYPAGKSSPELSRVGVGYKDKGSLPQGVREEPLPDDELPLEVSFEIEDLLDDWLRLVSNFSESK